MDDLLMIDRTIRTFKRIVALNPPGNVKLHELKVMVDPSLKHKHNHCLFCHYNPFCNTCPFKIMFDCDCYEAGYADIVGEMEFNRFIINLTTIRGIYAGLPMKRVRQIVNKMKI